MLDITPNYWWGTDSLFNKPTEDESATAFFSPPEFKRGLRVFCATTVAGREGEEELTAHPV